MVKRILSHVVFWSLMAADIAVSAVVVVVLYLPLVAAKAILAVVRGKLAARRSDSTTAQTT